MDGRPDHFSLLMGQNLRSDGLVKERCAGCGRGTAFHQDKHGVWWCQRCWKRTRRARAAEPEEEPEAPKVEGVEPPADDEIPTLEATPADADVEGASAGDDPDKFFGHDGGSNENDALDEIRHDKEMEELAQKKDDDGPGEP